MSNPNFLKKLKSMSPQLLDGNQIKMLVEKMKSFDHLKVADYNLGATYLSKWIYAMHKGAMDDKRASKSEAGSIRKK